MFLRLVIGLIAFATSSLQADLVAAVEGAGLDARVKRQQAASTVALRVSGMSCAASVEAVLIAQQGVLQALVDFLSGRAEVGWRGSWGG